MHLSRTLDDYARDIGGSGIKGWGRKEGGDNTIKFLNYESHRASKPQPKFTQPQIVRVGTNNVIVS